MEVRQGLDRIEWVPQVPYDRLLLVVAGPDGTIYRREFEAGQPPAFNLVQDGSPLADGAYTWELRLVPRIDPAQRRRVEVKPGADKVRSTSSLHSGQFAIQGGVLVTDADEARPAAVAGGPSSSSTNKDQTIVDDLIVDGRVCAGVDCVTGMAFADEELALFELNPGLTFLDSSSFGAGVSSQDWGIFTGFEGFENFSVYNYFGDVTVRPFTIEGSSPTGALWVDNNGYIGMGTTVPFWDLHIKTADTPGVLLEQANEIFPASAWHITGNETDFGVSDLVAGTAPFRLAPGAPQNSLRVAANGWVGLGTANPGGQLHIFGSATGDVFAGMGPNLNSGPGFNYGYAGGSFGRSAGFFNVRPDASAVAPNPSLRFATSNIERMILDNEGYLGLGVANPTSPIHHSTGAILTSGGTWQNASSRATKQDIAELAADEALRTVMGLAPVKFAYRVDPREKHVGFIAEDVPNLVAAPDRKSLSSMDIVAVLTKVVQDQQKTIEEQQKALEALTARLEALEQK